MLRKNDYREQLLGQKYIVMFIINLLCKNFNFETLKDLKIQI
jgi:hypothetical protein